MTAPTVPVTGAAAVAKLRPLLFVVLAVPEIGEATTRTRGPPCPVAVLVHGGRGDHLPSRPK